MTSQKYDWLHLFHEDFTGQLNKLYLGFRDAPWFVEQRERNLDAAKRLGFATIPALKKAVAERIRQYVEGGGFLFAMCGATETLELAIAAHNADIAAAYADGTPIDEDVDAKMDWKRAMAFRDVHVEQSPFTNSMSDIDGHQVNVPARRQPLGQFTLFAFSAKFDPVATMLVQDHRTVIPDYYGVTTSFNKAVHQAGRDGARVRGGRAVGEVHPRRLRKGLVDVPRWPRSGRPAAQHRQRADGSGAAPELAGLPADPEQRPVPGREEETAQDVIGVDCD